MPSRSGKRRFPSLGIFSGKIPPQAYSIRSPGIGVRQISAVLVVGMSSCFWITPGTSATPMANQALPIPPVQMAIPADSVSDDKAIAAINRVVDAGGGKRAWLDHPIIRQTFLFTGAQDGSSHSVTITDAWQEALPHFQRSYHSDQPREVEHAGLSLLKVRTEGKTRSLPEFDETVMLADHLPAAAAVLFILRPQRYVVKTSRGRCPAQSICVMAYGRAGDTGPFRPLSEWVIDRGSGQVEATLIALPNLSGAASSRMWQTHEYSDFRLESDLIVPNRIESTSPGSLKQPRTLQTTDFPRAVERTAGGQQ